jgi:hypothetical protein
MSTLFGLTAATIEEECTDEKADGYPAYGSSYDRS